jgi:hypothetical protein
MQKTFGMSLAFYELAYYDTNNRYNWRTDWISEAVGPIQPDLSVIPQHIPRPAYVNNGGREAAIPKTPVIWGPDEIDKVTVFNMPIGTGTACS